jgi:hypothetical protein
MPLNNKMMKMKFRRKRNKNQKVLLNFIALTLPAKLKIKMERNPGVNIKTTPNFKMNYKNKTYN